MNTFHNNFISKETMDQLRTVHNVVKSDGSVVVNKTYADVVKYSTSTPGMEEKYIPSEAELEKFKSLNPNAVVQNGCIVECNPLDKDVDSFKCNLFFNN